MSFAVWKIQINVQDGRQEVTVPRGAEFLHFNTQFEVPMLWFRCDPDAPKEKRLVVICGTGHPAPDPQRSTYIGTAILYNGSLVLHAFEIKPELV